jgi:8-oxo-dGTP diphosphatase
MRELQIVTGLARRERDLLMVRQAGAGEEPYWSVPGGRVAPGEFAPDALVREVAEETGVAVLDPGSLAFTLQVDDRRDGWFATVWVWEIAAWDGGVEARDPEGKVLEAGWVPLEKAKERLRRISWQPLTARYLAGEVARGSFWLRRVQADGREEWVGSFAPDHACGQIVTLSARTPCLCGTLLRDSPCKVPVADPSAEDAS